MAQEIELASGGEGKIRSFWVGLGLAVITLSIYYYCWYYFVNDELKDIGRDKGDENLAQSSPALSVTAILVGGWLIVPPLLSIYNYGQRIKRAQRLSGVGRADQINPILAFVLLMPGGFLIIPIFIHFWYVTKHQNIALRAAAGLPPTGEPVHHAALTAPGAPAPATATGESRHAGFAPPSSARPGGSAVASPPSDGRAAVTTPESDDEDAQPGPPGPPANA